MAVAFANLTVDPQTIVDADPDSDVRIVIRTNTEGAIIDEAAKKIFLGTYSVLTKTSVTISLPLTNGASNPTDYQYAAELFYVDAATRERKSWPSGWFSFTEAADLSEIVVEQYVPPTYISQATASLDAHAAGLEVTLDGYVTEAETAKTGAEDARDLAEQYRDEAHDISNIDTSDDVMTAVDADAGSDFRVQADARQSASYGAPIWLPAATGVAATDTANIQAAADLAYSRGGGIVRAREGAGQVYALGQAGTISLRNASGSVNATAPYCVKIPSGVLIDFNGATVKLSTGDVRLFVNANPGNAMGTVSDHDLGVINAVLDGNAVQLSASQLATFVGCLRLTLRNVRVTNGKGAGIFIYNNQDGEYTGLVADNWAGNPFPWGNPLTGADIRDARIGTIRCTDIAADALVPLSLPGNPFYAVLTRCTVDSLYAKNCAGGVKLDASTDAGGNNSTVGQVVFRGGALGTANSGLKIQGFDASTKVKRITVGLVVSTNNVLGSGLYVDQYTEDCVVQTYIGDGNGTDAAAASPDVWLSGTRNTVGDIKSSGTGLQALQVRSEATDYTVGRIRAYNSGLTAVTGSKFAVVVSSTNPGSIGDLIAIDDRGGSAIMARGLSYPDAAALTVGSMDIRGATNTPVLPGGASSGKLGSLRTHASDPMSGNVTLTAGTSTTVSNGNMNNATGAGYYVRTVVRLTPLNSAARLLAATGAMYPVITAGTMTLNHASAAGTEVFRWEIVGHVAEATNVTTTTDPVVPPMNQWRKMISGRYYGTTGSTPATSGATLNALTLTPLWVPHAITVDRIEMEVTTGVASSTFRVGIYSSDANDLPSALVNEYTTGTQIDASTTAVKSITISQALAPGLYWLAAVCQGAASTIRTIGTNAAPPVSATTFSASSGASGVNTYFQTGVTGALPSTPTVSFGSNGTKVMVRVA